MASKLLLDTIRLYSNEGGCTVVAGPAGHGVVTSHGVCLIKPRDRLRNWLIVTQDPIPSINRYQIARMLAEGGGAHEVGALAYVA